MNELDRISDALFQSDFDGYTYCRLCGVNGDREVRVHNDDCPVTVIAKQLDMPAIRRVA